MARYNVNVDKQVFMEFLLFEWYDGDKHWRKYPNNKYNYFRYLLKTKPKVLEEAVVYIEQGGNVIWDFKDKHARILNDMIPMGDWWGKKDFVKLWKQYKKEFYANPRELKHKYEY